MHFWCVFIACLTVPRQLKPWISWSVFESLKKNFSGQLLLRGKISFKSYIIINQSQKSKTKNFTFSWLLHGGRGSTQAVSKFSLNSIQESWLKVLFCNKENLPPRSPPFPNLIYKYACPMWCLCPVWNVELPDSTINVAKTKEVHTCSRSTICFATALLLVPHLSLQLT